MPANKATQVTLTRAAYAKWKASGVSSFVFTASYSGWSSVTVTFSNFQKVWIEEESETLSQAEMEKLGNATPYNDYKYNSYQFQSYGYGSMKSGDWTVYDSETGELKTVVFYLYDER